jgi:hypothetical protein
LPWLDREFGWSDETARKWMNVYELSLKFQPVERLKSAPRTTPCVALPVSAGRSLLFRARR